MSDSSPFTFSPIPDVDSEDGTRITTEPLADILKKLSNDVDTEDASAAGKGEGEQFAPFFLYAIEVIDQFYFFLIMQPFKFIYSTSILYLWSGSGCVFFLSFSRDLLIITIFII